MIGMKKYVRMSRFAHFKRLRDRPTNRPTDRPTDMTSYRSARTHLKRVMDDTRYHTYSCLRMHDKVSKKVRLKAALTKPSRTNGRLDRLRGTSLIVIRRIIWRTESFEVLDHRKLYISN